MDGAHRANNKSCCSSFLSCIITAILILIIAIGIKSYISIEFDDDHQSGLTAQVRILYGKFLRDFFKLQAFIVKMFESKEQSNKSSKNREEPIQQSKEQKNKEPQTNKNKGFEREEKKGEPIHTDEEEQHEVNSPMKMSLTDKLLQLLSPFKYNDVTADDNKAEVADAAKTLNTIFFKEYIERNRCDLLRGVQKSRFKDTVAKIKTLLKMPQELADTIVDAANFKHGKNDAVGHMDFKGTDGTLYFGKFAIVKTGKDEIAFSYSLHLVRFTLAPKSVQPKEEKIKELITFAPAGENKVEEGYITKTGVDLFKKLYVQRAYEGFQKNCLDQGAFEKNMLKGLKEKQDRDKSQQVGGEPKSDDRKRSVRAQSHV